MAHASSTERMVRTRVYRAGRLEATDFPVEQVSDYLEDSETTVWVDLCAPDRADLAVVAGELGLHTLAVDDAITSRQRPKLDRYETHEFLNIYAVGLDRDQRAAEPERALRLHRGAHALVTVRKDTAFDMDAVVARWDAGRTSSGNGVAFLLYGLLDEVVDGHFDAVEALDEEIEGLEDLLFDDRPGTRTCSDAASRCARAWSRCAASCCRCARC